MPTNIDYKYIALTSCDVLKAEIHVMYEYLCTNINIFEQRGILRLKGKTPLACTSQVYVLMFLI